jgi:hypothetical protein
MPGRAPSEAVFGSRSMALCSPAALRRRRRAAIRVRGGRAPRDGCAAATIRQVATMTTGPTSRAPSAADHFRGTLKKISQWQRESPCTTRDATAGLEPQAPRPLRLLRPQGQSGEALGLAASGRAAWVALVAPPLAARPLLGKDDSAAAALPAAHAESPTPHVANAVSRRAGCANRARPDLWGSGKATIRG